MPFDPTRHHRRSIRLRAYDYSQAGAYFVTACAQGRQCLFGSVSNGSIVRTRLGECVAGVWEALPARYPGVDLDAWVLMPNHLHGIVVLYEPAGVEEGGGTPPLPGSVLAGVPEGGGTPPLRGPVSASGTEEGALRQPSRRTLGQVVAAFKYLTTKEINRLHATPGQRVWQRNYYEHVVRDDADLERLRTYIIENPLRWELDQLHPDNPSPW
jgi:REP element-mobilizing transposase RayT